MIVRDEEQIERVRDWAQDAVCEDRTDYDLTYEQGVYDMAMWLLGQMDEAPDGS